MPVNEIQYSDKYSDEKYEYRHVILPSDLAREVPKTHLMSETEWRNLGVQQSPSWIHYMIHSPDSQIVPTVPARLSRFNKSGRYRILQLVLIVRTDQLLITSDHLNLNALCLNPNSEPHILLFRRLKADNFTTRLVPMTGMVRPISAN